MVTLGRMGAVSVHDILGWLARYGLVIVYLGPLLEVLVPFIPGELVLLLAGYLVNQGLLPMWPTIGVACAGAVSGVSVSYTGGRVLGARLVERYGHTLRLTRKRMRRVNRWYARYGKGTLTIGYFVAGVRHLMAFVAGMSRLGYPTFALFAYSGALLWATTLVLVGMYAAEPVIRFFLRYYREVAIAVGAVAVIAAAVYLLLRRILKGGRGRGGA